MRSELYVFTLDDGPSFSRALDAMTLALAAVQNIHAMPLVRLETHFDIHPAERRIKIDGSTRTARHLTQQFEGFLRRSLGDGGYTLRRESREHVKQDGIRGAA